MKVKQSAKKVNSVKNMLIATSSNKKRLLRKPNKQILGEFGAMLLER